MKWIAIILMTVTGIFIALWLVMGGSALTIALSVFSTILIVISAFSLGIWYAHKSIQLGAKLATEAQSNNDQWDTVKMQSLATFGNQILKLKGETNQSVNGFPQIENSAGVFEADFTIQNLESEE